jgi:hypothetical protein
LSKTIEHDAEAYLGARSLFPHRGSLPYDGSRHDLLPLQNRT